MRGLIPWLVCVLAIVGSAERPSLRFLWDVEQRVDPKHMLVIAINGKAVAPKIFANSGDLIAVQIRNGLENELEIYWQGLQKVLNRQCNGTDQPIPAGQVVNYCLAAKQAGEFLYQAQSKLQRDAGLTGSIVVL